VGGRWKKCWCAHFSPAASLGALALLNSACVVPRRAAGHAARAKHKTIAAAAAPFLSKNGSAADFFTPPCNKAYSSQALTAKWHTPEQKSQKQTRRKHARNYFASLWIYAVSKCISQNALDPFSTPEFATYISTLSEIRV
jgi:hypothetical protein